METISQKKTNIILIGLIGKKRVGKDTVANIIKKLHPNITTTYALADPIKDISRIMFNFTEKQLYDNEKDEIDFSWGIAPRHFFEQFGTEIMQFDIYKYLPSLEKLIPKRTFWVRSLLNKIEKNNISIETNTTNKIIIITDIRGLHELEEIKKTYPEAKFIKIIKKDNGNNNSEIDNSLTKEHITQLESNLIPDSLINTTIYNNMTIDDLEDAVEQFIKSIHLH
jgi:hypothetical protein